MPPGRVCQASRRDGLLSRDLRRGAVLTAGKGPLAAPTLRVGVPTTTTLLLKYIMYIIVRGRESMHVPARRTVTVALAVLAVRAAAALQAAATNQAS